MTSFCHQLKLLLWKNYILRKRHKVRMVLELLWPLILFLILMWVRTRGLLFHRPPCHIVEKALPSVGGFPFLQNFICTLNNTCYESRVEDNSGKDQWEKATLPKLVRETSPILNDLVGTSAAITNFGTFVDDTNRLAKIIIKRYLRFEFKLIGTVSLVSFLNSTAQQAFNRQQHPGFPQSLLDELLKTSVKLEEFNRASYNDLYATMDSSRCRGSSPTVFRLFSTADELLRILCESSSNESDLQTLRSDLLLFFQANVDKAAELYLKMVKLYYLDDVADGNFELLLSSGQIWPKHRKTLDNLRRLLKVMTSFRGDFVGLTSQSSMGPNNESSLSSTTVLFKAFCGFELSPNASAFGVGDDDGTNQYDTLRDRLRDWRSNRPYKVDREVSSICNTLFANLESQPLTNVMWRQVKPFIRGRLLYYPRTPFTETLMNKVDMKFSELKELEDTLNQALRIVHRIRLSLDVNKFDMELLVEILKGDFPNNIQDPSNPLPFNSTDLVLIGVIKTQLDAVLNNIDLNFIEAFLERMDFGSEVQSTVLDCIRYNKATPQKSEEIGNITVDSNFSSEDDVVRHGMHLMLDNELWAAIVFQDIPEDGSAPTHLKYKIRMDSDKVDGTRIIRDRITRKHPRRRPSLDIKYLTNGFIYLQELIEHSFIEIVTAEDLSGLSFVLQQFPFPCYIFDQFIKAISNTFPLFMVLSWVYASAMLIKSIVLEKELRLKEVMRVMGCGNSVIWTAWFLDSFVMMSVSCLILSFILKFGNVIQHSDFGVILMFLIVFSLATICFSFLVSTFFTKANSAAATGGILFFLAYLPYNFMLLWEDRLTWYHTMLSCLISNVAFGFGCTYIARLEEDGLGAQWNRLSIRTLPGDDFNFSYCILMLIFDSLLYLALALYLEAVFPGENGVPKKWYFFVQTSFWCPKASSMRRKGTADFGYQAYRDDENRPIVEADPEGLPCGVSVRHLCKKYSNGRVALADLNMSFYEGQITSFLGHNGAGKTTTISILTGLFPPTEGTALIYGFDIRKDIDMIRRDVGICPQHNVLFDKLTVEEHLQFYATLKGKAKLGKTEMDQMLIDLGIPHKKNEFPKNLSGGMKRKLSVAIAFVGGSRTVFLDEPTSGVDPYSRRSIWELLLKYKTGRTIILTTHFMDEADILGDRIAIISRGQLKACGTSLFLKAQFGQGYFLRLVREIEEPPTEEVMLNNIPPSKQNDAVSRITGTSQATSYMSRNTAAATRHTQLFGNFIKQRIPEAHLVSDVGSDVIFLLPSEKVGDFENLFKDLDDNMETLRVLSYGISDTTLEDVFLQITVEDLEQASGDHSATTCRGYCCTRRLWSAAWQSIKRKNKRKKSYHSIINVPVSSTPDVPVEPRLSNTRKVSVAPLPEVVVYPEDPGSPHEEEQPEEHASSENAPVEVDDVELIASETEAENEEILLPPSRRQSSLFGIRRDNIQSKFWVQIWVIVLKRFRNSNRNKKAIFFEIVVPALFIALMLASTLILPPPANEDNREVTYTAYDSPNSIFFSQPINPMPPFNKTVNELTGPLGLGTECLDKELPKGKCRGRWSQDAVDAFVARRGGVNNPTLGNCSCQSGSQMCGPGIERPPPPRFETRTKDYLLDVSKYEVSDWVIKTYFHYEPKRLGGYEMTMRSPEAYKVGEFLELADVLSQFAEDYNSKTPPKLQPNKPMNTVYKVWFENRAWLSSPAYLNGLHNVILRQNLPISQSQADYGITLYTHPMNLTEEQQKKESLKTAALGVVHAICVIFALSFVPASFTVYLIEERKSGAKHLHLISGVRPITYWVSNFLFDMFKYLFSSMLCVSLFYAFDAQAYIGNESVLGFITLLILYGWAAIPLMYPFSYVFGIPSTAFVVLACLNLFIGIITTVSTFVLEQLGDEELTEISEMLKQFFLIFPHYCLGRGLIELVKLHLQATAFGRLNLNVIEISRFEWDILGKLLVCLAIQGACFFAISILTEYKQWVYLLCCKKKIIKREQTVIQARASNGEDDEDVQKEADRVTRHPPPFASLLAQNLGKIYAGKKRPAVNNLCFAVEPGECFGLLGVNGAGKSTTFKMLTGDVRITSGKAYIMTFDVEKSLDMARKYYGYCPQEDGIDPLLNSYEQLELYGRLRGLTVQEVEGTATQLISSLGLTRYANKRCGTYSGGNKRKISTAIALIGNPQVLFLDEPTSGMDPGARRQLWKLITAVTRMGKSVILTSHSMEECEALCTRLAIMVNGRFTCLGSLQHLKNRFGKGYRLSVRCPVPNQPEFQESLLISLPFAELEDAHCSQLKFNIPQEKVKLNEIFHIMCTARADGLIEDFSVSQTTLDDIFIKFASEQRDELDGKQQGAGVGETTT